MLGGKEEFYSYPRMHSSAAVGTHHALRLIGASGHSECKQKLVPYGPRSDEALLGERQVGRNWCELLYVQTVIPFQRPSR